MAPWEAMKINTESKNNNIYSEPRESLNTIISFVQYLDQMYWQALC